MGRGEENKAKINETIAIKIISQTDLEFNLKKVWEGGKTI